MAKSKLEKKALVRSILNHSFFIGNNQKISKLLLLALLCFCASASASSDDVSVNVTSVRYQHITGFGAAAMGDLMRPIQDTAIIAKLYGDDSPVGLNIMRIEVSPNLVGDVTTKWWDTPYDWHGYIDAVKCAKRRGAIILGTPWSPPADYKTNNSTKGEDSLGVGGRLKAENYKDFFPWLNSFCEYMKSNNASVDIVSIQNEPDWQVSYSGCLYTPSEMHALVRDYGHLFTGAKLMGGESLKFNPAYTDSLLNDTSTCKYFSYIGGHFYGSGVKYAPKAAATAMAHGMEAWMTEHYVDPRNENSLGDSKVYDSPLWSEQILFANEVNEAMTANLSAYVCWYMRANYAFMGDGKTVASGSGNEDMQITKRGYIMSHFTKNITGSTRLGATISASDEMETSAYIKGDSLIVMVINGDSDSNDLNVVFNLPYSVKSCTRTVTTESLTCDKDELTIAEPTRKPKFVLAPSSISTYVFTIDRNATGISHTSASPTPTTVSTYTLDGVKVDSQKIQEKTSGNRPKGIYIINGKKVII
jgi:glucuronoarabinoxylan endo-1,4-beta-xylanase